MTEKVKDDLNKAIKLLTDLEYAIRTQPTPERNWFYARDKIRRALRYLAKIEEFYKL